MLGAGAGAVTAMMKSIKENRALAKKKRTSNDHSGAKRGEPLQYKKASEKDLEEFRANLKLKKRKDQRLTIMIFTAFVGIPAGVFFYYLLFVF